MAVAVPFSSLRSSLLDHSPRMTCALFLTALQGKPQFAHNALHPVDGEAHIYRNGSTDLLQ